MSDLIQDTELIKKALHRAYSLGQKYWQQADSESYKQNALADQTEAKFDALVSETLASLYASPVELSEQPTANSSYLAAGASSETVQTALPWVPVSERLPAPGKPVLAFFCNSLGRGRTARAHYAPLHTVDASHWDDEITDDTEDGSYEPEGWWEDPAVGERLEFISDEVTHWMKLPAPPLNGADNEVQKPNKTDSPKGVL